MTPRARFAAIVLAAGHARRFHGNKLLARVRGRSLLGAALAAAAGSGARPVLLVVGHRRGALRSEIRSALSVTRRRAWLRVVYNPAHAQGLSTSLRSGIRAVPAHCPGTLVLLADVPGLRRATLDGVMAAWRPGDTAVVATRKGEWGHPVLLAREIFPWMEGLAGDQGARRLLQDAAGVRTLEVRDDPTGDIDTRAQWRHARKRRTRAG